MAVRGTGQRIGSTLVTAGHLTLASLSPAIHGRETKGDKTWQPQEKIRHQTRLPSTEIASTESKTIRLSRLELETKCTQLSRDAVGSGDQDEMGLAGRRLAFYSFAEGLL